MKEKSKWSASCDFYGCINYANIVFYSAFVSPCTIHCIDIKPKDTYTCWFCYWCH